MNDFIWVTKVFILNKIPSMTSNVSVKFQTCPGHGYVMMRVTGTEELLYYGIKNINLLVSNNFFFIPMNYF